MNHDKKRLLYIDTETTGLDPKRHALREIACILMENGTPIASFESTINPLTYRQRGVEIDQYALDVSGKSIEELKSYSDSQTVFQDFIVFLERHKHGKDKFQLSGYSVNFDIGFLKAWFLDNVHKEDKHYKDYFSHKPVDVYALVLELKYRGLIHTENDKLATICNRFCIPLNAHNAFDDIAATATLHDILARNFITGGSMTIEQFEAAVKALWIEYGMNPQEIKRPFSVKTMSLGHGKLVSVTPQYHLEGIGDDSFYHVEDTYQKAFTRCLHTINARFVKAKAKS